MTQEKYNETAALVVRLRKELEHTNQHLVAHIDALTKSNAQCGEYLRRNEQLHSELVEVRAALASVTEQRDSLRRTLDEWERADTKPHERIYHQPLPDELEFRAVVPTPEMLAVCSWWEVQGRGDVICFKNKDQRPVVWRSLHGDASWQYEDCPQPLKPSKRTWRQLDALLAEPPSAAISTHDMPPLRMGLVSSGGPVYIHDDVADHVVPPVLPLCMKCHGCGFVLETDSRPGALYCMNFKCDRTNTADTDSPYNGPCNSAVRHE